MTIHLPEDVENSVFDAVHRGQFASPDELVTQAVRSFLRQQKPPPPKPGLGLIGALRDDAELLDQAVEHAMKVREERPWRLAPGE